MPSGERDIDKLQKSYATAKLHDDHPGRRPWADAQDQTRNCSSNGAHKLSETHPLSTWNDG